MLAQFGGFAGIIRKRKSVIDNTTFRLHYRTTFAILLACTVLVSLNQYIGSPIMCIVSGIPAGLMGTYCWISGTFTIPSQLAGVIGHDMPHPGIGPVTYDELAQERGHVGFTDDGDVLRHAWYQWVCFVLFLQAIMFYTPHYIWKTFEGGKLSMMITGLDGTFLAAPPAELDTKRKSVVTYLKRTCGTHNLYAYKFVICECLNLVNILFQLYLMDVFFNGQFSRFGLDVLNVVEMPLEDRVDPLSRVFPKVTKCSFHKYGPSGSVEKHDGLCVLALNIINEKIYVFLWFWFIGLALWTGFHTLFRLISVASKQSRLLILRHRIRSVDAEIVRIVLDKSSFGDWFLLAQMAEHIHPTFMTDVMHGLHEQYVPKLAENASNASSEDDSTQDVASPHVRT